MLQAWCLSLTDFFLLFLLAVNSFTPVLARLNDWVKETVPTDFLLFFFTCSKQFHTCSYSFK
jgi:hypothetical protein